VGESDGAVSGGGDDAGGGREHFWGDGPAVGDPWPERGHDDVPQRASDAAGGLVSGRGLGVVRVGRGVHSADKDGGDPEDTDAYYTAGTAAYSDAAFAKTNFKRARWSAAWGTKTGFTAFAAQKGFNINWDMRTKAVPTDGLGTVDMSLDGLVGTCRCIPIQPTIAQIEAVMQGRAHGALLSAGAADLVLTESGGGTVTLKNAGALEHGYAFGVEPLRIGEMAWATTRGFTAGAPAAVGAVATT